MSDMKVKARFLEFPEWTQARTGSNDIKLLKDWCFLVSLDDGPEIEYWVPAGYVCDGASVPRAFWVLPGVGSCTDPINVAGAFAHDPLFETHALSFSICNEIARQLWIQAGKSEFGAREMWLAIASPAGLLAWHNTDEHLEQLKADRALILDRSDNIDKFTSMWFVWEQ